MSRIRTNLITNRMANGAPTVSNGLVISGVTTSTTFSGSGASLTNIPDSALSAVTASKLTGALPAIDGSNLTGLSGVSVANQADNRLITVTGTTDALNGEANLTFDGDNLTITGSNHVTQILKAGGATSDLHIDFKDSSNNLEARIFCASDQGDLRFYTGGANERIRINSSGLVMIGTTTEGTGSGDDLTISNTGNMGLTLRSTSSNYCNIYFSDAIF